MDKSGQTSSGQNTQQQGADQPALPQRGQLRRPAPPQAGQTNDEPGQMTGTHFTDWASI